MTVKQLINRLKEFDENYEIEIQYYNVDGCQTLTRPSIDRDLDIYVEEDESGEKGQKVIIDLGDF